MSKLDEARERLQNAMAALETTAREKAASAATARASAPAPDSTADPAELGALKSRNQALEARNAEVSERLDRAIGRIREILEG